MCISCLSLSHLCSSESSCPTLATNSRAAWTAWEFNESRFSAIKTGIRHKSCSGFKYIEVMIAKSAQIGKPLVVKTSKHDFWMKVPICVSVPVRLPTKLRGVGHCSTCKQPKMEGLTGFPLLHMIISWIFYGQFWSNTCK